jgi:hypothetical protein
MEFLIWLLYLGGVLQLVHGGMCVQRAMDEDKSPGQKIMLHAGHRNQQLEARAAGSWEHLDRYLAQDGAGSGMSMVEQTDSYSIIKFYVDHVASCESSCLMPKEDAHIVSPALESIRHIFPHCSICATSKCGLSNDT